MCGCKNGGNVQPVINNYQPPQQYVSTYVPPQNINNCQTTQEFLNSIIVIIDNWLNSGILLPKDVTEFQNYRQQIMTGLTTGNYCYTNYNQIYLQIDGVTRHY